MKEKKIINDIINFILENKYENSEIIYHQYNHSMYSVEKDISGFFAYFEYNGNEKCSMLNYEINNISGFINNEEEVSFTIYIRNGILDEIEAYTYGGVPFPENNEIEIREIKI